MPQNYDSAPGDPNLGDESAQDLAALSQHIGEWWGEGMVWHEIVSEYVHLDVHAIPPSSSQPYHVLVTTGMSDRPMILREGFESYRYCELMLALPSSWQMTQEAFSDERNYWPIRHLKQTARFPHIVETWLWHGHTVGNGNDVAPVAPGIPFVGFALWTPKLCPTGARSRHIRDGKEVHFFALIPLYEAELKFAWELGTQELFQKMDAAGVSEVVDITRSCVITGKRPPRSVTEKPSFVTRIRQWFRR